MCMYSRSYGRPNITNRSPVGKPEAVNIKE